MTTQYYYIADRIFPKAPITSAWVASIRQHANATPHGDALIIYHVSHEPTTTQLRIVLDYATQTPEESLAYYHRFLQALAEFFNAALPIKSRNLIREGDAFGTTHAVGSTWVLDLALDHYDGALFSAYGDCYGEAKSVVVQLNELHTVAQLAWQSVIETYIP